jgi:hypothetical protein
MHEAETLPERSTFHAPATWPPTWLAFKHVSYIYSLRSILLFTNTDISVSKKKTDISTTKIYLDIYIYISKEYYGSKGVHVFIYPHKIQMGCISRLKLATLIDVPPNVEGKWHKCLYILDIVLLG